MSSWSGISGSPGTMQTILNGFAGASPCVSQLSCAAVVQRNALFTFTRSLPPPCCHLPPGFLQLSVVAMLPSSKAGCPNTRFPKMLLNCIWVTGWQLCFCQDLCFCSWSHSDVAGHKAWDKNGRVYFTCGQELFVNHLLNFWLLEESLWLLYTIHRCYLCLTSKLALFWSAGWD